MSRHRKSRYSRPLCTKHSCHGSRFLDSEQRIVASKVIKRYILHAKKTAFVIEHDFIMATYLADRVIVFGGRPAVAATATPYVIAPCDVMIRSPSSSLNN